ncbi:SPX domain-containing protein 2 [Actinidia rufa]|uniref:SPX domain-containing protein 2 n=1 Tax=Actinidia rufa TaxID=165716 RepID=A0A7J0GC48_9ERIC|nr:SPX domain-containing protein 2 [Actinidia rufa]
MKFSKNLSNLIEQTLPDWRDQFLSYKDLKKQLKMIYPKDGGPSTSGPYRPNKRPRLDGDAAAEEMERKRRWWRRRTISAESLRKCLYCILKPECTPSIIFCCLAVFNEQHILSQHAFDRVAEVQDSSEELMTVGREIVDFHGEMVLLLNYSALNYTGLVKILKKYDKRSGALIRLPFIQKVLQQPFFTTDILNNLVKECETMLDRFFSMNEQLGTYQVTERKERPFEAEVLLSACFSLPPLQTNSSKSSWKKIPVIEQAAK